MPIHKLVIAALLLSGCASAPPQQTDAHDPYRIMREIPQEFQRDVALAEAFGTELYLQDLAAWVVTDFLAEKGVLEKDNRLRGWITEHVEGEKEPPRMLVTFVGEVEGDYRALYQVETELSEVLHETYKVYPDGQALSDRQLAMFNARQTAVHAEFMACSERYNTAVIPFIDDEVDYYLVYLLAATTQQGEVKLGGNHLITIDASGEEIVEQRALSNSCITMERTEEVEALTVSHLVEPTPNAVHVFLSLLHRVPIYLITTQNNVFWKIEGNTISVLER